MSKVVFILKKWGNPFPILGFSLVAMSEEKTLAYPVVYMKFSVILKYPGPNRLTLKYPGQRLCLTFVYFVYFSLFTFLTPIP